MLTNAIDCTIERRLLVNYRIDPEVVMRHLPAPFRPQLISEWAVGGVCFIRLGGLRPAHFPSTLGLTTENVAHRFAVEWDDEEGTQVGVYIPGRATDSRITAWAGDRIFPGVHQFAQFQVAEGGAGVQIDVERRRGPLRLSVAAQESDSLTGELFGSLDDAISFFGRGSLGFSPSGHADRLVGVRLESQGWGARPVVIGTWCQACSTTRANSHKARALSTLDLSCVTSPLAGAVEGPCKSSP